MIGATEGIRTHDLAFTKRLLYQLSYGGVGGIIPKDFPGGLMSLGLFHLLCPLNDLFTITLAKCVDRFEQFVFLLQSGIP